MKSSLSIILSVAALILVTACGDDPPPENTAGDLTIEAAFSAEAQVGQNTLEITVTGAGGDAVTDATVVVDPQMPSMGHGSSETATVTNNGDGTYTAFPVTLQMPGAWVVIVTAERGDDSGRLELDVNP